MVVLIKKQKIKRFIMEKCMYQDNASSCEDCPNKEECKNGKQE